MSSGTTYHVDPRCPDVQAFIGRLKQDLNAREMSGELKRIIAPAKFEEFASQHEPTCIRCKAYVGPRASHDNRSAIWGGAAVGLIVGLVAGFFRESYWQTVLYAVGIGAALGLGVEVLARVGSLLRRK